MEVKEKFKAWITHSNILLSLLDEFVFHYGQLALYVPFVPIDNEV